MGEGRHLPRGGGVRCRSARHRDVRRVV